MYRVLVRGILLIAGLGLLVVWLDSNQFFDRSIRNLPTNEPETAEKRPQTRTSSLVIRKDDEGFFYVDAWVNNDSVRFLVDTGASTVYLTRGTAEYLGFDFWDEEFDTTVRTAGDEDLLGKKIILDEININDEIIVYNVNAIVLMEGQYDLLGMTFLNKLSGYSVEGDVMILRP